MLLILVFLAACSPTNPEQPTPASSPPEATTQLSPRPTAQPRVTTVPEPEAPPSALMLWAVAEAQQADRLKQLIADISAQVGAEVAVVTKSADALQADIRADQLAGRPPPDLIWGSQEDLGLLQRAGMIQPSSDGLPNDAFIPATLMSGSLDGQRWGTPLAAQGYLLLLYNKKLVDAPPPTTDDLIARSRSLTGGDQYGLVTAWSEPRWFMAWLNGFGGAPTAEDGTPTLNTPQLISALNLLKELRPSGPPPPSTYGEGASLFTQGKAAFAVDGDWALERYRQYTDTLDLGIARMPVVPATGRIATPPLGGVYLMYADRLSGPRLDQARALGVALTQPEAQTRIARDLGQLPALLAIHADPAVQENPALAAAAAQLEGAAGLPAAAGLRCAWRSIAANLPPVLLGEATQEEAAQRMQDNAMACASEES